MIASLKLNRFALPKREVMYQQLQGISSSVLHLWKKELAEDSENAFPGVGRLKPSAEEIRQLNREKKRLKVERDFLKKP